MNLTMKEGPKHVPTPKLIVCKRNLFGSNSKPSSMMLVDDDDLGPMNPIYLNPRSYDGPLENRPFKHLREQRSDFKNIMEKLTLAINWSCQISQEDNPTKKIISSHSQPNTISNDFFTQAVLEKENCINELNKTPVSRKVTREVEKSPIRYTKFVAFGEVSKIRPFEAGMKEEKLDEFVTTDRKRFFRAKITDAPPKKKFKKINERFAEQNVTSRIYKI